MTTMHTLYWIRPDGAGDFNMGSFPTKAAAEAAIPAARAELIDQCPGPAIETNAEFTRCRDQIIEGRWVVSTKERELH
jgi:hypothetical protein